MGRQREIVEIGCLLVESRLVTLTGPGGVGKSRLALEVAGRATSRYPGGMWLVDVGGLTDGSRLPDAVVAVVSGDSHRTKPQSADDVADRIGGRRMLVLFDNCEHLVDACAHLVERLLAACPAVNVLTTSRERLAIGGEHGWTVRPLSLPDPEGVASARSVVSTEAGELFVQRATEASASFWLTDGCAPTVARICRRLDGMPLAIELAAERVASLAPADILERLDDRFRFLKTTSSTVAPRHQSMLAALEWSHDLLTPAEAALLRRVSVFAGWTLAAAEEVCVGGPVQRGDVVDHLAGLVRKSLVVVDERDARARYRLLETIRVWIGAKLRGFSEAAAVRHAHALWYLRLAERADDDLGGRRQKAWLDDLDIEHDNLRVALEWARETGQVDMALRLVTALARFWRLRGYIEEGQRWLDWAVVASAESPVPLQAKALRAAGLLRGLQGDIASALPLLERSSALYAGAGDHEASTCTCNPAFVLSRDPRHALPMLEERAGFCRRTGDTNGLSHLLFSIGQIQYIHGAADDARRHFEECVQLGRGAPDGEALRSGLLGLARLELLLGDLIRAEGWAAEARLLAGDADDAVDSAQALAYLADVARARGQWDKARDLLSESDRLARESGLPISIACTLYSFARLAESLGEPDAGDLFEQSLSVAQAGEVPVFHEIRCRVGMGSAAESQGDFGAAAGHLLDALNRAETINDVGPSAEALHRLSIVARRQGESCEATSLARRSLELYHRIGALGGIAAALESLAGLGLDARPDAAARLFAAAGAFRHSQGYARSRPEQARYEFDVGELRSRLATEVFTAVSAEGAAMSAAEAVAYAVRGRRNANRPTSGWDSLTPAEREVVRLVGEGLTNPEVSQRLFISPRTVGHHLRHVFDKLGMRSRGALIKEMAGREI